MAFGKEGRTSIKDEKEKNLRRDQEKYVKEYHGDTEQMLEDSHIALIRETIEKRIDAFGSEIEEENFKKLNYLIVL